MAKEKTNKSFHLAIFLKALQAAFEKSPENLPGMPMAEIAEQVIEEHLGDQAKSFRDEIGKATTEERSALVDSIVNSPSLGDAVQAATAWLAARTQPVESAA